MIEKKEFKLDNLISVQIHKSIREDCNLKVEYLIKTHHKYHPAVAYSYCLHLVVRLLRMMVLHLVQVVHQIHVHPVEWVKPDLDHLYTCCYICCFEEMKLNVIELNFRYDAI